MARTDKKPNFTLYTSGACAAAAAKGAAYMLINDCEANEIVLALPACVRVRFRLLDITRGRSFVKCAVAKKWRNSDGTDEIAYIYAKISKTKTAGQVVITGGEGIGRYVRDFGEFKEGKAAINSMTKFLIQNAILDYLESNKVSYGFLVELSCPNGRNIAESFVNSAYGIEGGIALIGQNGIIGKESTDDKLDKIRAALEERRLTGHATAILAEKNYAADLSAQLAAPLDEQDICAYRDYITETSAMIDALGFENIVFINNLSRSAGFAGGVADNNGSDYRLMILTAHAAMLGISESSAKALMNAGSTEKAVLILKKEGVFEEVIKSLAKSIAAVFAEYYPKRQVGFIIFTEADGVIYQSENAAELLSK